MIRRLVVLSVVFGASVLQAELPSLPLELSLEKALKLTEQYNPDLKRVTEKRSEQDGVLRQIKARRRPHLDATGDYSLSDDGLVQQFGEGPESEDVRWILGVEASVTVFAGGRSKKLIEASEERLGGVVEEIRETRQLVLLDLYRAYYAARLSLDTIEEQEEAIRVLEEQLEEAQNREKAGVGTKFDSMQAEVALANARPPLIRAKNSYRRNVDVLRQVIGLPYAEGKDSADVTVAEPKQPEAVEMSLDAALEKALAGRAEFALLERELAASQRNVEAVEREQRPVVDVYGGYDYRNDQFGGEDLEGWNVGVRMRWNFVDGGAHQGRLMETRSLHRQISHQHDRLKLGVEGEIRRAHYTRQEAEAIYKSTQSAIKSAEEALRLAQNRFRAGKGTQLDVLEGRLQLTRARLELSMAKHDYFLSVISMKAAVGENL